MISQEDITAFQNMYDSKKIEKIKEVVSKGYVRDVWKMNSRSTMIYPLNKFEMEQNTEIVEKLKSLLGL